MKDKETFDESMEATIKRLNDAALSGAIVTCFASDLNRALALLTRPATLEDRTCGWVYDADHDYYTTECGEDIAFPEMDRKPPIGREWLKFCSGCGKKALLREAGRVKSPDKTLEELASCPFCGEREFLNHTLQDGGRAVSLNSMTAVAVGGLYCIVCRNCGARGPETTHKDYAVAVARWNDQSATAAQQREVEGLQAALTELLEWAEETEFAHKDDDGTWLWSKSGERIIADSALSHSGKEGV